MLYRIICVLCYISRYAILLYSIYILSINTRYLALSSVYIDTLNEFVYWYKVELLKLDKKKTR